MTFFASGLLFSGLLALLFALGELIARKRDRYNLLLFFIFLCVAGMLLHAYGLFSGTLARVPHLLGWYLPCLLALGPLLDLFMRFKTGLVFENPGRLTLIMHLAPAFLSMAGLAVYLTTDAQAKVALIRAFQGDGPAPAVLPWLGLANLHLLAYIVLGGRRILAAVKNGAARSSGRPSFVRIHLMILGAAVLIALILLGGFFFPRTMLIPAGLVVLILIPPAIYLARFRFPDYFRELETAIRRAKYENSQLKGRDLDEIEKELEKLMLEEKLYRRDDLSLPFLAERAGLSPHQLSEYFNRHLKMNFAAFVNGHRIREARELLVGDPDLTVLAAAYQVGFNSKSSFNAAFSRETGLTPSAYRARHASSR